MAALGCPGNMAAVMGAMEPMEEYVQVVVGEDGDPSQVVVLQGEGGELLRSVQELSPELLQSISPTDTVYYVQPDGSLVPGGRLGEVQTGGRGLEAAHMVTEGVEAAHMVTEGVEAAHMVTEGVEAAHMVTEGVEAAQLVSGGHGVEAAHLMSEGHGGLEAAHLVSGGVEAAHLGSGDHGVETTHLVTGGVEITHLVSGDHEVETTHLVSGDHVNETAHLVSGDHGVETTHLVTGGVETTHLVTGGVETAHLVSGDHVNEAAHPVSGGHEGEAAHLVSGGHVDEAEDSEGQGMEAAVNLVTRVEEAVHPGMILLSGEHPGVSLVTGGHVLEVVQPDMSLVNGGQMEETVHSVNEGLEEEDPVEEEEADMVTALNLTNEAARRTRDTAEDSQVPDGVTLQSQPLPMVVSKLPTFPAGVTMLKDAAQQLKSVAHQVALREAESLPRVLTHKELKSIHFQVPSGLQTKKSADPVVLNLSTVHLKNASPSLLGAQVVQIKSLSESRPPLVVNSSSLDSPVQIFVRQAQLSARNPGTPDPNNNRSYVTYPQNGAHVSADHAQKKGHKRKKPIKVKTRSGRISRPPKHKAKDYKFLKVGDLIQGSTSDSEDFSEPSSEDDEKGTKENAPRDRPPYTVKNALFQCQTCEKSYMGKGGLSRHYRLYPSHGQMEPPFVSDDKKNGESGVGHSVPSVPKKPTPRPRKRLLEDPLNPDSSSPPSLAKDGLEFVPASSTCRGRQQVTGRRFGHPRKVLAKAPTEQNALTAKELIQQCEDADIKEHVAPCLSARLSVYDFLVVKVKQDHPDTPLFPHLYKELENLHNMVRILAQEYFSNGGAGKTLEVADCKVAASLGISAEKIINVFPSDLSSVKEEKMESADECSAEERTPPAKRLRVDDPGNVSPAMDVTTGGAPDIHEEQRTDPPCKNDTGSDDTNNCTEQVTELLHPNVMKEEAENLHTGSDLYSAPCDVTLEEHSQTLLSSSSPPPSEPPGDAIEEDTDAENVLSGSHADQPPCPQAYAADSALPSEAPPTTLEKTCSEGFQGVDSFIPPEMIDSDQCTQAFGFHHGHDLVFVHSSEGTATGEAVVIYDSAESIAEAQMDAVVALVEMK